MNINKLSPVGSDTDNEDCLSEYDNVTPPHSDGEDCDASVSGGVDVSGGVGASGGSSGVLGTPRRNWRPGTGMIMGVSSLLMGVERSRTLAVLASVGGGSGHVGADSGSADTAEGTTSTVEKGK